MQVHRAATSNSTLADKSNRSWPGLATPARQALATICGNGARLYQRAAMLPHLLPDFAVSLGLPEPAQTAAIIATLHRLLRIERARRGHWTYDLNRHISLSQALQGEVAHQAQRTQKTPPP